ncbi:translation initiation factor 2 [Pseudomonas fontis]|uniref:Translation initiation factor 2 n=1 Tax=Pseudomonas fontis TaxID=2942633 RepID=A0ABT5NXD1_9PSED|nr:translation initiation factor 2 [Pseudomonas fontis]MDD0974066.1 translation initiation factor 2 [Pseudomonas fontis]MDD0992849.1 translation initiation factor 2 [Pseudomonas fontis]
MKVLSRVGLLLLCLSLLPSVAPVFAATASPSVDSTNALQAKKKPAPVKKPEAARPKTQAKPPVAKKAPAKTNQRKGSDVVAAPLPKAKLDLSLPPDMVKGLQAPGQAEAQVRQPLLPAMFGEKPTSNSPFQLNGRLLSNEMQLQLRNDARQQEIEGAAIEFEFKQ